MKTLILLLLLVSCNNVFKPDYKVGDCIQLDRKMEPWETNDMVFHVVEIGQRKYRTLWISPKYMVGREWIESIDVADRYYKKVGCPK